MMWKFDILDHQNSKGTDLAHVHRLSIGSAPNASYGGTSDNKLPQTNNEISMKLFLFPMEYGLLVPLNKKSLRIIREMVVSIIIQRFHALYVGTAE